MCAFPLHAADSLTLTDAIGRTLASHPQVSAAKAKWDAEREAIGMSQWPRDPSFGIMYEQNQNFMQQQMGPMTSLVFSQEIEFPAKYIFRGWVQESRASGAKEELAQAKVTLRRRVVTAFYQLFSVQRVRELIDAQKEIVREIARIAEARHSIGAVTQQDEMKAHVEQTSVENELVEVEQEEEALQSKLALLLAEESSTHFKLDKTLPIPTVEFDKLNLADSRRAKKDAIRVQEYCLEKQLTWFDYAPDLRLSARTMVGGNAPANNFAFSIDMTLPLWFFGRQKSEINAVTARSREALYNLEKTKRELNSDAKEVTAKIRMYQKLMRNFDTTLIPQAESTLRASRTAYQAGKASFFELLDSARAIFTVRMAYYRHLADYVEQIALLEELCGCSLSSLPVGDDL
jgi:cobalt-zinc-cadmium efflux system outer membrane protein